MGRRARAARLGDGLFWPGNLSGRIHAPGDQQALRGLLATLRQECDRIGRDPTEVEITVGANRPTAAHVHELAELGVARIVVATPSATNRPARLGSLLALVRSAVA